MRIRDAVTLERMRLNGIKLLLYQAKTGEPVPSETEAVLYRHVILLLLEVSFFMYTVAPSIPASYRLSAMIIILADYSQSALPGHYELLSEQMYRMVVELVKSEEMSKQRGEREGFEGLVSLEVINFLLATCCLGPNLRLSEDLASKAFDIESHNDYFHLVTCFSYMADDLRYSKLAKHIRNLPPPVVCPMILLSRREHRRATGGDIHKAVWQPAALCIPLF